MKLREELGEFSSVICLKAIITGMENTLGEKLTAIALIAAGRIRGQHLASDNKLETFNIKTDSDLNKLTKKVSDVLGENGTRLLVLHKIERKGDLYYAYTTETICSAGEEIGSNRHCTFTLGAIQGVLEWVSGEKFRGVQVDSVLRDSEFDVFEYGPRLRSK